MYFKKILFSIIILIFLSSCAFVPVTANHQNYKCDMNTKQLTLSMKEIKGIGFNSSGNGRDLVAYLLALGVVIPLGTLVVSGGIVLLGNTLHWLEYQGRCTDGYILKSITKLKEANKNLP